MIITQKTGKAELCFVKVPEGAAAFRTVGSNLVSTMPKIYSIGSLRERWTRIPAGNWQIVGNPFELSEENLIPIVPQMKDSGFPFEVQEITDTWKDLLDKWGIYQTNPFADPESTMRQGDGYVYYGASDEEFAEYAEAEGRTGNWILLRKI